MTQEICTYRTTLRQGVKLPPPVPYSLLVVILLLFLSPALLLAAPDSLATSGEAEPVVSLRQPTFFQRLLNTGWLWYLVGVALWFGGVWLYRYTKRSGRS
jgi:hypothetical protein